MVHVEGASVRRLILTAWQTFCGPTGFTIRSVASCACQVYGHFHSSGNIKSLAFPPLQCLAVYRFLVNEKASGISCGCLLGCKERGHFASFLQCGYSDFLKIAVPPNLGNKYKPTIFIDIGTSMKSWYCSLLNHF